MILQPIFAWWILLLIFAAPFALVIFILVADRKDKKNRRNWIRRLAVVILILIMSLRPSIPGASTQGGNGLLDVYFLIDTTVSSVAEDYNGNKPRIDGMRQDVKDIASKLVGARFGIIGFDNQITTPLPLTTDTSTLSTMVDVLPTQNIYNASGSSIDLPITSIRDEIARISKQTPERGRVIFYLGDGEQTANSKPKRFSALKNLVAGGAVLGYGTTQGGKMRDITNYGGDKDYDNGYVKDYSNKETLRTIDAVSKIDEGNLKKIAEEAGLKYFHRTKPGDIDEIIKGIDVGKIIADSRETDTYHDLYWLISPLMTVLVAFDAWQVYLASKALRKLRKKEKTL